MKAAPTKRTTTNKEAYPLVAGIPKFRYKLTEGLVFLQKTGTPNYLKPNKLTEYHRLSAAGQNPSYPVLFGVAAVLFRRAEYFNGFDRDFRRLKVDHLGVDVPMHEYDLRGRREPPFDALRDPVKWASFRDDLEAVFAAHEFGIIVVAIHKPQMQDSYQLPAWPFHPYHYALENIVERTAMESKNYGPTWRVVAEDRDEGLNLDLNAEMYRLQLNGCGKG